MANDQDKQEHPVHEGAKVEDPWDKAKRECGFDLLPMQRSRWHGLLVHPDTTEDIRIWANETLQQRKSLIEFPHNPMLSLHSRFQAPNYTSAKGISRVPFGIRRGPSFGQSRRLCFVPGG